MIRWTALLPSPLPQVSIPVFMALSARLKGERYAPSEAASSDAGNEDLMEREKCEKQERLTVLSKKCVEGDQLQAALLAQAVVGGGEAVAPETGDGEPRSVDAGQPMAPSVGRQGYR